MLGRKLSGKWWIVVAVVAVVAIVGTGFIVWSPWEEPPVFAWEDCEAPSIDETRGFDDTPPQQWDGMPVEAVKVADLPDVTSMSFPPGSETALVTTKPGVLLSLAADGSFTELLDLSDEVLNGSDQGMPSVAVDPDGRYLYLTYIDFDGSVVLDEFEWDGAAPDPSTRRKVRTIPQPQEWHNGGTIVFGPDGYLYLGLGDGGSIGDQFDNGQELDRPYASILRFDPHRDGDDPYTIPSDNPYEGRTDAPATWVWGLRMPWKFSFDRDTGDLWIGDVGQNCIEEVDLVPADSEGGLNFGWSRLEGTYRFRGYLPGEHTLPVIEYTHDEGGCAIIGGYVYRGAELADLNGHYLFADYCRGKVYALNSDNGQAVALFELGVKLSLLTSFAEGPDGEIYILTLEQGIWKLVPGS